MGLTIHTHLGPLDETGAPKKRRRLRRERQPRARLSRTDRLLRSSTAACALLLGILALGNIKQPWAEKASESIERALTMRIDLDESIGGLTFVREIMPESALVFLNLSGGAELTRPLNAALLHPWSAVQPWLMCDSSEGAEVCAADAGTVTAVSPMSDGRVGVLLDHGGGLESIYSGLARADIAAGARVERGQALGVSGGALYYELREGGVPVDPTARLGL